jgi:hypothetical protein
VKRNNAEQPIINSYVFIQGRDVRRNPNDFGVQESRSTGYFKSSCIFFFANTSNNHPDDLGTDARSINDIEIQYTYNGTRRTLRHSYG